MTNEHTIQAFDRDLERIRAEIRTMGRLVVAAMDGAVDALLRHDESLARNVIAGDGEIDAREEAVGAEVARLIALHAPTASDLRLALAILRMSTDLERAGDHAKTIARRSLEIDGIVANDETKAILTEISARVRRMLGDAMDAFAKLDPALATEVRERDVEVDELYNQFVRTALRRASDTEAGRAAELQLQFVAKDLERIGDHATNLSEQVIYLVTGQMPADDRPRANAALPPQGEF